MSVVVIIIIAAVDVSLRPGTKLSAPYAASAFTGAPFAVEDAAAPFPTTPALLSPGAAGDDFLFFAGGNASLVPLDAPASLASAPPPGAADPAAAAAVAAAALAFALDLFSCLGGGRPSPSKTWAGSCEHLMCRTTMPIDESS